MVLFSEYLEQVLEQLWTIALGQFLDQDDNKHAGRRTEDKQW